MTLSLKENLLILAVAVCLAISFVLVATAYGEVNFNTNTEPNGYSVFNFFTATTTTATSTNLAGGGGYMKVAGAKKVTMYFSRGDTSGQGNTGSTNFKVEVSPDGVSWFQYNRLIQNVATGTTPTTLSSVTISAATSTVLENVDVQSGAYYGIRCIAVETTDGEHTCKASAEY